MNVRSNGPGGEVLRIVLNDLEVEQLRRAAEKRGMAVEDFIHVLLAAANAQLETLLPHDSRGPA